KCDMCIDRVHNGMLPACVQACPTGTMNFGDREDMLGLAKQRLSKVKGEFPKARLIDSESVRTIYLCGLEPSLYHTCVTAEATLPRGFDRRGLLASVLRPFAASTSG
ncbi:MAG: formate dehydrogenase, partial [Desulfovibrionaceae bacterium]|nr:formate dehydrogenase [Desulfovibrionaceae bacterium]